MPRPPKSRKVCHVPQNLEFIPTREAEGKEPVILSVDEYETIRLIDLEGMSQEQCCERMEIARTTVQKIYDTARGKIASVLVEGRPLRIEGGSYRLCNGHSVSCADTECYKQKLGKFYNIGKGENIMRIAVTYENGEVFQHFGHTETFKIYDVEDGNIIDTQVISTNGSGHGVLAEVLYTLHADALICGGIGGGAQMALAEVGVKLYGGVSGNADAAVNAWITGELAYDPDVHCNRHGHGEGHTCGSHGCGGHSCHD